MDKENYVYRLYQTMSSGALPPARYYRKLSPGHRTASKAERAAFSTAAAARYAAVNGIDVVAVKSDKATVMGGRPTRGEEI